MRISAGIYHALRYRRTGGFDLLQDFNPSRSLTDRTITKHGIIVLALAAVQVYPSVRFRFQEPCSCPQNAMIRAKSQDTNGGSVEERFSINNYGNCWCFLYRSSFVVAFQKRKRYKNGKSKGSRDDRLRRKRRG